MLTSGGLQLASRPSCVFKTTCTCAPFVLFSRRHYTPGVSFKRVSAWTKFSHHFNKSPCHTLLQCRLFTSTMAQQAQIGEYRDLYPEIEAFDTGFLKVSDVHSLYYEQSGNKDGNPVVFLHGGPGGGTSPRDRRFFDPKAYRIILFDQRGSGKSTPAAELKDNTTWHLVEDIERLREHLKIEKWVVFGGSWGSTLSLAYSQTYPARVKALVLRGIFTLRRKELEWFYEGKGANFMFPDHFDEYISHIPEVERGAVIDAYYRRLTSEDESVRTEAARRWSTWEMATSHLYVNEEKLQKAGTEPTWSLQFARIECHYFVNGGFFESGSHLLDNVDKIRSIPATIVQGRYDMVCPATSAWELHKRWPEADFFMIPDSGHNSNEPGTRTKLLDATDKYKSL
ncbi:probable proline iminopeptidase isoform X2 [Aplysia californica]|uniref:Proline iminopeptidase n=1 Tax=Aplysia californica TaxID=6500 RepID=A0ABM1VTD1_APLCA|nr:probable proline iminopeptidase isoform X2 [Aplysia californica]